MRRSQRASGFTLIEIIATLVIVSVLATFAYIYFGKGFLESVTPVTRLKQTAALHRVMENITADYNVFPKWRSGQSYAAGASVIPSNPNRRYYTCTTAGTSGTTEPDWWSSGPAFTEPTGVKWTDSGSLKTLLPLPTLQTRIGAEGSVQSANEYGKNSDGTYTTYTVVKNRFVRFVNDVEQDDTSGSNNILKVTLQNENGETLTSLFLSD